MTYKILLVDDEEKVRFLVRRILECDGYEVIEASNGLEGLSKIKKNRPDLVLLDVMMPPLPGMNTGWEVAEEIKKLDETILVVMLTVRDESEDGFKSSKYGADWHINKPVRIETLLATVHWLLEKHTSQHREIIDAWDAVLKKSDPIEKGKILEEVANLIFKSINCFEGAVNLSYNISMGRLSVFHRGDIL